MCYSGVSKITLGIPSEADPGDHHRGARMRTGTCAVAYAHLQSAGPDRCTPLWK
jgi:hypothetical protein